MIFQCPYINLFLYPHENHIMCRTIRSKGAFAPVMLFVCLALTALPAFAVGNAADNMAAAQSVTVQVGDLYYKLNAASGQTAGTAVVVKPGKASYTFSSVSIPAKITDTDGAEYAVTAIGSNAFEGARNLTGITIPPTILTIGASAFKGCLSLKEMRIEPAESPLEIPDKIFDNTDDAVAKLAPLYCS